MKTIKAQDVKPGDKIKIDAYGSLEVATVHANKLPCGQMAYSFFSPRGMRVWNRHGEELILV